MSDAVSALRTFLHEDDGATAVEYGLMLALIAAVIFTAVDLLGGKVEDAFTDLDAQWP